MKVVLDYDKSSGQLSDAKGNYVGNYLGLFSFEEEERAALTTRNKVDELMHMKQLGYSLEEILQLKKAGVL